MQRRLTEVPISVIVDQREQAELVGSPLNPPMHVGITDV